MSRLLQQLLAYISVQATLPLFGEETFVAFNSVLFVYLLGLAAFQPVLNFIWKREACLLPDIAFAFVISFFVALVFYGFNILSFLVIFFVLSRMLERVVYISIASGGGILKAQLVLLLMLFVEMFLIFVVSSVMPNAGISERLVSSIFPFLVCSAPFLFFLLVSDRDRDRDRERDRFRIPNEYFKKRLFMWDVALYYIASSALVNLDRFLAPESSYFSSSSYLWYLSFFTALFGLLSVYIDRLRWEIATRGKDAINYKGVLFYLLPFFLISIVLYSLQGQTWFFEYFISLPELDIFILASQGALVGGVFCLMYCSTVRLHEGRILIPTAILIFLTAGKVLAVLVFGVDTVWINYSVMVFVVVALLYMIFRPVAKFK